MGKDYGKIQADVLSIRKCAGAAGTGALERSPRTSDGQCASSATVGVRACAESASAWSQADPARCQRAKSRAPCPVLGRPLGVWILGRIASRLRSHHRECANWRQSPARCRGDASPRKAARRSSARHAHQRERRVHHDAREVRRIPRESSHGRTHRAGANASLGWNHYFGSSLRLKNLERAGVTPL